MSHPKRLFSTHASAASSSSNPISPSAAPAMKKAKNGLNAHPFDVSDDAADDDTMLVDQAEDLKAGAPSSGVASNLSRKKATPPQPASTKKQLVIKLNKGKPKLPTNFEENTWAILKSAITAIFLKQPDPCDSEKLYQAVNDLCLHKMAGSLYERIQKECEVHISTRLQSLVGQSPDLVVFLSSVEKYWQDFCDQMLTIRSIALYLDRTYVKQNPTVRSLWDMGLQLFRKHLSLSQEVEHKIVTGLLRLIEKERCTIFS